MLSKASIKLCLKQLGIVIFQSWGKVSTQSLSNPSKDTHQQVIKIAVMITNINSFNPHSSSKNLVPLLQITDGEASCEGT